MKKFMNILLVTEYFVNGGGGGGGGGVTAVGIKIFENMTVTCCDG